MATRAAPIRKTGLNPNHSPKAPPSAGPSPNPQNKAVVYQPYDRHILGHGDISDTQDIMVGPKAAMPTPRSR